MKKITILALHLGYGGVEKSIVLLANMLCDTYSIEIISTYQLFDKPAFNLDDRIKVTYLMKEKPNRDCLNKAIAKKDVLQIFKELYFSVKVLYKRRTYMVKAIKACESDYIVSTRDFHNKLLAKHKRKGIISIGWEHNHHNYDNKYIRRIVNSVKYLDYAVFVSKEQEEFYTKLLTNYHVKCKYVPNCIENVPDESSLLDNRNLVAIGRLSKEKGMDDVIRAFYKISQEDKNAQLTIIGDGNEREFLQNLTKQLNVDNKVIFKGFQTSEKIHACLLDSIVLLMGSHTESFGIVILEAFARGVPVIAFDSAQGACDLIDNGVNGYLIENRDIDLMAIRAKRLIEKPYECKVLARNAKQTANNFTCDVIKNAWIQEIFEK